MNTHIERRKFLQQTAAATLTTGAVMTFGTTAPSVLCQAAAAANSDERILVVVEMAGGNDGLNSVIPHSDPAYQKARAKLAIKKADVLAVNDSVGLHPAMRGFADLLEQDRFAVVQGVGYPNPNRSHFESMDIWHSCQRKTDPRHDGWIGRYLETGDLKNLSDPPAVHLGGDKQPFALMSRDVRVPSIQSLEQFRLRDNGSVDIRAILRELDNQSTENDLLSFVQSSTSSAITASERMETATKNFKSAESYPTSGLARKLETVAKLIASRIGTRVYYVRIDGFDTHANQADAHRALLREVSDAVSHFVNDLSDRGDGERTLVMCFSEFGRRVAENASGGTDHGTAGPVFMVGNRIRAGLIGELPSLTNLDQGDVKYHTDFRQVYAAVLTDWLNAPADQVLGKFFDPVKLFKA